MAGKRTNKKSSRGVPVDPLAWTEADWKDLHEAIEAAIERIAARHVRPAPRPGPPACPGHGPHGTGEPCCDRAGIYNGYGSDGPTIFTCPKSCSCHD